MNDTETPAGSSPLRPYVAAAALCIVTTAVALPLLEFLDPPNIVVLFLLAVFLAALKLGRGPAVASAFLANWQSKWRQTRVSMCWTA